MPNSWRSLTETVVLGLVLGIILSALIFLVPPMITGGLVAFIAAIFIIPVVPGVVEFLSNKPNRFRREGDTERNYKLDNFGFFTFLQPGRVKMIERGDSFVRAIMDWDGKTFKGELPDNDLNRDQWTYWEVVNSGKNPDAHPLPFPLPKDEERQPLWLLYSPLSIFWWLWKRWVYAITGGVFTGIPPYQTVRTYPIERFKLLIGQNGETELRRVLDYSDHYRVAQFQFPTAVPRADTQDLIEVKWLVNQIARVVNPFMVAYNTDDDWTARYFAAIANAITNVSRSLPANELLASINIEASRVIGNRISQLANESVGGIEGIEGFGLRVERTEIIDVTPTDPVIARKLGDVAVAKVDCLAAEERAKGHAAPIREQGKALREYPEAAIIPQNEALVRTAAAAGDKAIVNIGGGRSVSAGEAALIKEIRETIESRRQAS